MPFHTLKSFNTSWINSLNGARIIASAGQLATCFCVYFYVAISPCWEPNHYVSISSISSYINESKIGKYDLNAIFSMFYAGLICAIFYLLALSALLLGQNDKQSNRLSYRCAAEMMWEHEYKPRWLYFAFITSGNYCARSPYGFGGESYINKGKPTITALKQLLGKRVNEIAALVSLVAIMLFMLSIRPPVLFYLICTLLMMCANGCIEFVIAAKLKIMEN